MNVLTFRLEKIYPYEVLLKVNSINGLSIDSKIKLDQIRVIDKTRISNKIGVIDDSEIINKILGALDVLLDREGYFR